MSRELDYYRLIVKPGRLNDWVVYDRTQEMKSDVAQNKSDAIKKAKAQAHQWVKNSRFDEVGIEKRTKTGKKSYEVVRK